jgi:signal transduction histidine kinase/FixJ family two-component response regulator
MSGSSAPAKLLIVDDEVAQMRALCDTLEPHGYVTRGFPSAREALATLELEHFDLLLTDLMMPEMDGIALLRSSQEIDRDLACIVMTGHGTIATAVSALKAGALDYILKPFRMNHILPALARALGTRQLRLENIQLRESVAIYELSRAITKGLTHDEVIQQTLRAALKPSDGAAAYVLVSAPEERVLKVAGSAGAGSESLQGASFPIGLETEEWVARARRDLDALDSAREPAALFAPPFGSAIRVALPIVAGEQLYGVLGVSFARTDRRVGRGQLKALDILARTAATAFETASHVSQLQDMNQVLESRVRERTRELEIANKDLESFSYSVSHDLREPLRAVEGFCELFRSEFESSVPEPGRKLLERVWSGASRMNQLINDLLHFSRFGREPLSCLRVPLREMILAIVAALAQRAGPRQVNVHVEDLPDCYGDRALLEQVLVNLLSNSFKFTAGRALARIEVGCLRQAERIVYYVRDNGVGFDMKYADKLFGVFQRLHSKDAFEGTGIGLSIVHRIIQRHGGSVWADSRPDEGTTLYFSLPQQAERCAA